MSDDRIKTYWSREMKALLDTYNQFQTLIPAQKRAGAAHPGEDGRYVEYLLKEYLKRYLPRDLEVLTGFILRPAVKCGDHDRSRQKDEHEASGQLDILIADTAHFPVYQRFGDSVILPPEGVAGIISVKKHLRRSDIIHECQMLSQALALCPHARGGVPEVSACPVKKERRPARSPFTALLTMEDAFDEKLKKPMSSARKRQEAYKRMKDLYQQKKTLFYDEMVDFVGALSQWGIYKERPGKKKETFYLGFDFENGHESLGFQLILQGILDVYYANMSQSIVRPGFTDNSGEGYVEKQGPIGFHCQNIVRKETIET